MAARSGSTRSSKSRKGRAPAPSHLDLGIDLGTTRTVVARADRGNYPVLSFTDTNGDSHDYYPSLTALTEDGLVHGFRARRAAREGAPLLRSLKRALAAPSVSASSTVTLGDRTLSIGEVLVSFLTDLRQRLAMSGVLDGADPGSEDANVVVAVPAHAYGAQRLLTLDAFPAPPASSTRTARRPPCPPGARGYWSTISAEGPSTPPWSMSTAPPTRCWPLEDWVISAVTTSISSWPSWRWRARPWMRPF